MNGVSSGDHPLLSVLFFLLTLPVVNGALLVVTMKAYALYRSTSWARPS